MNYSHFIYLKLVENLLVKIERMEVGRGERR